MSPISSFDINTVVVSDLDAPTKVSLSFIAKEIYGNIFPVFLLFYIVSNASPIYIKKTNPSHNCFSKFFIHEGRLFISDMLLLY